MEDDLKKMKKMEDNLKIKWKTNQSTKINLIGCDTIVNSPSINLVLHNVTRYSCVGKLMFSSLQSFFEVIFQERESYDGSSGKNCNWLRYGILYFPHFEFFHFL